MKSHKEQDRDGELDEDPHEDRNEVRNGNREVELGENRDVDREEGSIEAGLTLIPTTAFFLLVLQLVVAGSVKTVETMKLQSWLNKSALYAVDGEISDRVIVSSLPGGGELLMAEESSRVPSIATSGGASTREKEPIVSLQAIAVRE